MSDPKQKNGATLVAGEETHEVESQPPKRPEAPKGDSEHDPATLVAGEETHEIEQEGKKTD